MLKKCLNRIIVLQIHRVEKDIIKKTELIGNKDPYKLSKNQFLVDFDNFPSISYPDIVNYFVFRPSPHSADDMNLYKSLKDYNQVIEGRVRDVKVNLNKN